MAEARERGLFLDLDGTLADSLPVMKQAYRAFLAHHGRQGSDEEFAELNGPPLRRVVEMVAASHRLPGTTEELLDLWHRLVEQAYLEVRPAPGALELLAAARRHGWRRCVVTSSQSAFARLWLDKVGLGGLVEGVVGGDHCRRGKPDPEPYLMALAEMGCAAGRSLAVEDSPQGATAARLAGLVTYILGPPPPAPAGIIAAASLFDLVPLMEARP